jgi:low temperature requirement protein LtrA
MMGNTPGMMGNTPGMMGNTPGMMGFGKSTFGNLKSTFGSAGGTFMMFIFYVLVILGMYWAYYHFVKKQPAPLFAKLMRKPGFGRRR